MKKILSIVIALTMIMAMLVPFGIYASAAEVVECATWADVVAAVTANSAASIKLTDNVTADTTIASFAGTFDGNGKTITVTTTMFTLAKSGATFKNFTMNGDTTITPFIDHVGEDSATAPITFEGVTSNVNTTITSGTAAPFIGYAEKAAIVAMTDCVNNGNLNSKNQAGAFIARTYNNSLTATFINCVNNGDIITTSNYAGGFIGMLDNGKHTITIDGCVNSGTVSAVGSDAAGFIGDVAGSSKNTVVITNSINSGKIINNKSANSNEKYNASGFVARFDKGASLTIANCLSTATEFESKVGHAAYFCNYVATGTFTLTNCYYVDANLGDLHKGSLELGEGCQMTAVDAAQLASGEVAFNLNKRLDTVVNWYQELGVDAAPSPIGEEVVSLDENGNYVNGYVHEHSWTAWFTTKAATCTANGVKTRTCTCSCEAYEDKIIPATGHTEEIVEGYAASCTEPGLTDGVICSDCGETLVAQEEIPATGHTEEVVTGKAPTCTETGLTDGVICSVCGETLLAQEEIPANGHTYEAVVTAPTCTEAGYTTYTCACGDSYIADEVAATGHSYEAVVTAPTCTAAGYTTYTCACGDTYVADEVAATGHTYEAVVTAPTCTEAGYTTYTCACGDSYIADEVAATGHSYVAVVTAPTCTEAGYTTYTCACGDTYKADEVAATGHTYGEWVITKEPTTEAEGEKTRTCACGATETVAIDKLAVPETADNTNIAIFAIVAVATMGCAVVVIKKREN